MKVLVIIAIKVYIKVINLNFIIFIISCLVFLIYFFEKNVIILRFRKILFYMTHNEYIFVNFNSIKLFILLFLIIQNGSYCNYYDDRNHFVVPNTSFNDSMGTICQPVVNVCFTNSTSYMDTVPVDSIHNSGLNTPIHTFDSCRSMLLSSSLLTVTNSSPSSLLRTVTTSADSTTPNSTYRVQMNGLAHRSNVSLGYDAHRNRQFSRLTPTSSTTTRPVMSYGNQLTSYARPNFGTSKFFILKWKSVI